MTAAPSSASGPPAGLVLQLTAARRHYGEVAALAPTSLALAGGTVTVVTGPNGSGKTTLLRLAAGLLRPAAGDRLVSGPSLYLAGGHGARAAQRAEEAVADVLGLVGEKRAAARARAREALAVVGLADWAGARAGTLSAGQRARLTLAIALVCRADLLCLDEPTAHLDEAGSALAGDVLRRLRARGAAVLVATHDPAWTAWTADAHLRLARGRLEQAAKEVVRP